MRSDGSHCHSSTRYLLGATDANYRHRPWYRTIYRCAQTGLAEAYAPNVIGLRLRHEIAHRHVFNHAPAQRADALVGHGILLSEPKLLTPRSSDRTTRAIIAPTSVPAATLRSALYRASGFVH